MTSEHAAPVVVDSPVDGVAVIRLARPDRLNAISNAVIDGLIEAVETVNADREVRAVVVEGDGRAFCAGADISEFSGFSGPVEFLAFLSRLGRALDLLEHSPKPSVAALHGVAMGGGLELALACDLRVADENTRLGVPEVKLGLLPGAGGTVRLARLLPAGVARRMVLTGEPLSAAEALAHGVVAEVVEAGQAHRAAVDLATTLASLAPIALAAAKRLLTAGPAVPVPEALELERQTVAGLYATKDRVEGLAAFLEKRKPTFTGE
jgi:enoyl-CoA hydratase